MWGRVLFAAAGVAEVVVVVVPVVAVAEVAAVAAVAGVVEYMFAGQRGPIAGFAGVGALFGAKIRFGL